MGISQNWTACNLSYSGKHCCIKNMRKCKNQRGNPSTWLCHWMPWFLEKQGVKAVYKILFEIKKKKQKLMWARNLWWSIVRRISETAKLLHRCNDLISLDNTIYLCLSISHIQKLVIQSHTIICELSSIPRVTASEYQLWWACVRCLSINKWYYRPIKQHSLFLKFLWHLHTKKIL